MNWLEYLALLTGMFTGGVILGFVDALIEDRDWKSWVEDLRRAVRPRPITQRMPEPMWLRVVTLLDVLFAPLWYALWWAISIVAACFALWDGGLKKTIKVILEGITGPGYYGVLRQISIRLYKRTNACRIRVDAWKKAKAEHWESVRIEPVFHHETDVD